ncbi:hypothetical protein [Rubritalea marina]|uniref:hypothetical protein n=1 Tax=Rubritalea marina TaxID=361055 RepID=UPI00035D9598|nr:hypothetical protein [Rubritalea marina]
MNQLFKVLMISLGLLLSTGVASASLKPGEILLKGKLVDYDRKAKELTFYVEKLDRELTFAFETRKGPHITYNIKEYSIKRYQSKQDKMLFEAIVVYQPLSEYDKTNVDMKGYVVRTLGGRDKEFHDKLTKPEKSKR